MKTGTKMRLFAPEAGAGTVNTRGQSSLSQTSIETENDFIDVRGRRQRRKNQHKHTGKAEVNGSIGVGNFEASNYKPPEQKKIWLFISKTKSTVTEEIVQTYIASKGKVNKEDVKVKLLQTKVTRKNNCFLIGVPFSLKEAVYSDDFWPQGVQYERFNFRIGKHFLDGPSETETK